jgi:3-phenylpropionate/trans-cinnamate dioxygenase ferredoxin reductase component
MDPTAVGREAVMSDTYVIIGGGLVGVSAAEELRTWGADGRIVIVDRHQDLPYDHPPLSKGYLLGDMGRDEVFLHPAPWYDEREIELRLGATATALDRDERRVTLEDGEVLGYTAVVLATGSTARALPVPGADLHGVHTLRTLPDADALVDAFRRGGSVVVVGAGWIGLETAAAARRHGCDVVVVEPQETAVQAALGRRIGDVLVGVHRDHGVDFRFGRSVVRFVDGGSGAVAGVALDDETTVPADVVVVGVGATPDTTLAAAAGLAGQGGRVGGVDTDTDLRADADIVAAGDIAASDSPLYGGRIRVEHWANALDGGKAAARTLLGRPADRDPVPFFFSDQYDLGLEFAGWFPPGSDASGEVDVVIRGDVDSGAFHAGWLRGDRMLAAMHVNMWDDGLEPLQHLIRIGAAVDRDRFADTSVALGEVAT